VDGHEVAAKYEADAGDESGAVAGVLCPHQQVGEDACQSEMQDDGVVEHEGKGQEQVKQTERIKNPRLQCGEEGVAAMVIGVPEGEGTLLQGFHPEQAWRDKIIAKIPLDQQVFAGKDIMEKQSHQEEEQESHACDFYGIFHALLIPVGTAAQSAFVVLIKQQKPFSISNP
jgi:hypothetical protein